MKGRKEGHLMKLHHHAWLALLSVVLLATLGCKDPSPTDDARDGEPTEEQHDPKAYAAKQDKEALRAFKEDKTAEAREWCSPEAKTHVGWKVSRADMLKMVEALYAAGATKVWISDIHEMNGGEVAAGVIVQLPDDPAARKRVFEYDANWRKEVEDEEKNPDMGQKYIVYSLDM
jgi:hypothetical protein